MFGRTWSCPLWCTGLRLWNDSWHWFQVITLIHPVWETWYKVWGSHFHSRRVGNDSFAENYLLWVLRGLKWDVHQNRSSTWMPSAPFVSNKLFILNMSLAKNTHVSIKKHSAEHSPTRNNIGSRNCRKFMTICGKSMERWGYVRNETAFMAQELLSNHLGRFQLNICLKGICWADATFQKGKGGMNNSWSKAEKQLAADARELDNCGEQLDLLCIFFECFWILFFLNFPARLGIALWGVSQGSLMTISANLIWWQVSTHQIEAIHTNVQQPYMDRDLGIYIYI